MARSAKAKSLPIKEIFETFLFLLLADRRRTGLWSRIVPPEIAEAYAKKEKDIVISSGSLSLTALAMEDLYYCSKVMRSKDQSVLRYLLEYYASDEGGLGLIVPDPIRGQRVEPNPRHTSFILRVVFLANYPIDEKDLCKHVRYLIATQSKDGGWGVTPSTSADPVNTAIVLSVLDYVNKSNHCIHMSQTLRETIKQGVSYLASRFHEDKGWSSTELFLDNIRATSAILTLFYNLQNYNKDLYEKALHIIKNYFKTECFNNINPAFIPHCIWVLNALAENGHVETKEILEFIENIIQEHNVVASILSNSNIQLLDMIMFIRLCKYLKELDINSNVISGLEEYTERIIIYSLLSNNRKVKSMIKEKFPLLRQEDLNYIYSFIGKISKKAYEEKEIKNEIERIRRRKLIAVYTTTLMISVILLIYILVKYLGIDVLYSLIISGIGGTVIASILINIISDLIVKIINVILKIIQKDT